MSNTGQAVKFLESQSKDSGNSDLHEYCLHHKNQEIAKYLDNGGDTELRNNKGYTPLHLACFVGNKYAVETLFKAGSDIHVIDNDGNNILHICAVVGDSEIAKFLIDKGADINHLDANKCNLLHQCAVVNNVEFLEYLINKLDIESEDAFGNSPLNVALHFGSIEAAICLIENEADLDHSNQDSVCPQDLLNEMEGAI